jgi:hypothetical protein
MIPLKSRIENLRASYGDLKNIFEQQGFVLGGGYEYDHGFFDKPLDPESDQAHRAYLRVPIFSVEGNIEEDNATVRLGKPFVLKHEFKTGPDDRVTTGAFSGLVNQFAEPADKDDAVETVWVERAKSALDELERGLDPLIH